MARFQVFSGKQIIHLITRRAEQQCLVLAPSFISLQAPLLDFLAEQFLFYNLAVLQLTGQNVYRLHRFCQVLFLEPGQDFQVHNANLKLDLNL